MEQSISLAKREQCTGCGACMEICPKEAIIFQPDEEGFPSPVIDNEKCVRCGLCEQTCPALHAPAAHPIQAAYAAQILDADALKESTSGGVFTALAREIFRRGGVVYGCVWDIDYNAVVCKAENEAEMKPMRGSKYVWSWAGDTFPEIKQYLEAGRTVLFTGLPCQAAGLKNYLRKDYENLYLAAFFCGGSPSPFAFHEYLKTITRDVSLEQLDLKFRDKEKHGVGVHITYNASNGRTDQTYIQNPFYFGFYSKVFLRAPCYHCAYRYENRLEDITFGDYWGIGNYHAEFNVRDGVSCVLVNTDKGAELLDSVKDGLQLSETKAESIAAGNNLSLGNKHKEFPVPVFRDAFFETLRRSGWRVAERKYLLNKTRLKLWVKQKLPARYVSGIKKLMRR